MSQCNLKVITAALKIIISLLNNSDVVFVEFFQGTMMMIGYCYCCFCLEKEKKKMDDNYHYHYHGNFG